MTVISSDSKNLLILVSSIDDVTGPTNVPPSSYAVGWRAAVRDGSPNNGRTFVVVEDGSGSHIWKEQLTSVGGALPDHRFTVAPSGYNLNDPGTNTFTTPEAGVAAAFAGTGTSLGGPAGNAQRFVWLHPALYDGLGGSLGLRAWVHLIGCADGAEASILENYAITYGESGDVTISGVYLSNCTISAAAGSSGKITFRDCRFESVSLEHASSDQVDWFFVDCHGTIPTWTINGTGVATFNVVGGGQTAFGTFSSSRVMSIDTISMGIDGAVVELNLTGPVVLDYSGAFLCSVSDSSAFQLTVDGAKVSSSGAKSAMLSVGANGQAGVSCRGQAVLPQTTNLANTAAGSSVTVDINQFESEGTLTTPYAPIGIVGPGQLFQSSSGSRPRGFTAQQSVVCVPGASVASQTIDVVYGAYDRIVLVPNYAPLALNPDTGSPSFQFASALLVDPSKLPLGHEIDVINGRTSAANQSNQVGGPIALRLPNGSSSKIGFFSSDLSVRPIFSSADYVILGPGQSCRLTVAQDPVNGSFLYHVSGIGADTSLLTALESQDGPLLESDWYVTTRDCWSLLGILPGFNGSNTTSGYPFMPVQSLLCTGARFYWADATPGTVRVRIYNGAGVSIANVNVAVNGIGDYTATFATAVELKALTRYWVTTYLVGGAGWTGGISGSAPARFLVAPQPMRGWVRLGGVCNSNGAGDVLPTIILAEQPMLLVPTFNRI